MPTVWRVSAAALAPGWSAEAALAAAQGREPDGIDPATHAVRSASIVLPENVSFHEAAADALEAREGVAHTSV